ncbi:hypothetical protein SAMN05428975_3129 [Mucilaginibacter sp. OK268]|nr:hypothetical protein SAMN05428975_3129 [Mucilaginibacter sp. OK268]
MGESRTLGCEAIQTEANRKNNNGKFQWKGYDMPPCNLKADGFKKLCKGPEYLLLFIAFVFLNNKRSLKIFKTEMFIKATIQHI